MTGVLWTHVNTFMPANYESAPPVNTPNQYLPLDVHYTNTVSFDVSLANLSLTFDPDPLGPTQSADLPSPVIAFTQTADQSLALQRNASGMADVSQRFTSAALIAARLELIRFCRHQIYAAFLTSSKSNSNSLGVA